MKRKLNTSPTAAVELEERKKWKVIKKKVQRASKIGFDVYSRLFSLIIKELFQMDYRRKTIYCEKSCFFFLMKYIFWCLSVRK